MSPKEWQQIQDAGRQHRKAQRQYQRNVSLAFIGIILGYVVIGGLALWGLIHLWK